MYEVMWWVTVAGYLITAVLCIICALNKKSNKSNRNIWWGLAASMLVLSINKQQNLMGTIASTVRQNAIQQDWYSSRYGLQSTLIRAFLLAGFLLLILLLRYRRSISPLQWLAMIGVIFLSGFALIQAVSLHAIDTFLYSSVAGMQPNWIIELGGIALVAIPSSLALHQKQ